MAVSGFAEGSIIKLMRRFAKLMRYIPILFLASISMPTTASKAAVYFEEEKSQNSDGLRLSHWVRFGAPIYSRGWVLSRAELGSVPQGLPYPAITTVNLSSQAFFVWCKQKDGYPFRSEWRLDAHDSSSWLLGELEAVCDVEHFADYHPRIFEPVCFFDPKRLVAW